MLLSYNKNYILSICKILQFFDISSIAINARKSPRFSSNRFDDPRRHPGVTFRLSSGNFEDISDRLDGGLVDFGLFVGDAAVAKYDYIKLPHSDAWGLLMRTDNALAERATVRPQDLDGLALLCSRQAVAGNELSGWLGREFGELDIVATYNLIHNATYMVEAGMGCAVSIEGLVNTSGTGLVFRPFEPSLTARLSFAWKRGRQLSRAAAEFLKLLQSKIG